MTKEDKISQNFGNWLYANCPKQIRKEKHGVLIKFLYVLYKEEIKSLGLKGMTNKQLLKEIFLRKELHRPIIKEEKKQCVQQTANFSKRRSRIIKKAKGNIDLESFYLKDEWLSLKNKVHKLYKCGCMKCGKEGIETHVDHIFPRSTYPYLELNIHNLQILCKKCNIEKSNKNTIDYRTKEQIELCRKKYN